MIVRGNDANDYRNVRLLRWPGDCASRVGWRDPTHTNVRTLWRTCCFAWPGDADGEADARTTSRVDGRITPLLAADANHSAGSMMLRETNIVLRGTNMLRARNAHLLFENNNGSFQAPYTSREQRSRRV